jgi:hypothetical protein
MNDFAAELAQKRESHTIDKIDEILQRRLYHRFAGTDRGEAEHRALPEILMIAFGDGNVELFRDPGLNALDDPALALERVIFGQNQIELENPHDHGGGALAEAFLA